MPAYFPTVYDRIWELLEAHPAFADAPDPAWTGPRVKPGDRVRFTARRRAPLARPPSRQPDDFPEAILGFGGGSVSAFTGKTGYGTHAVGANPAGQAWLEMRSRMFKLAVTHRDQKYDDAELLTEAVYVALLRGGARLGLDWVWQWGPVTDDLALAPNNRLAQTIFIPVTIRIEGATLLA